MAKIGFLLFFWLGFSAVVSEAAGKRNRSSFGWFLLALMISPLLAGLLVLALGKGRPKTVYLTQAPVEVPANTGGRSMDDLQAFDRLRQSHPGFSDNCYEETVHKGIFESP
jgi:hypothetical protein